VETWGDDKGWVPVGWKEKSVEELREYDIQLPQVRPLLLLINIEISLSTEGPS
jgi:hypothetical protein